ncbi:uncharacterized protein LOC133742542 [Rosa rugosa]|uniref:uncharacterized protein LOC133742542 n=1 Tax=Rosa rugosa TaxID=74645 RepID=UPI002B4114E8|nr:uncharacterized protein LOC133742542 [Rosa rugosa]
MTRGEGSLVAKTESSDENPNQRLCSVLLNEFNYLAWSRAVTLALGGRSKLNFVNDKNNIPDASSSEYESWLSKDQLVMSWLINSMEPKLAEIFSYSESSRHLWDAVKDMYGNLDNAARVFQLKKDLAGIQQGNLSFVQHLGNLKAKWNELDMYRPHTTDTTILLKRAEEDKVFQLLASLGSEYEDLRSHLLMSPEFPSFTTVCNSIQREEVRKKVMNMDSRAGGSEVRAFAANKSVTSDRTYKGKRPDLKCTHCERIGRTGIGHTRDRCWILHPELKPKFNEDHKNQRGTIQRSSYISNPKANFGNTSEEMMNFTSNPITLINEFATYLQKKQGSLESNENGSTTSMLGKFAGFLAKSNMASSEDIPGSSVQEEDW